MSSSNKTSVLGSGAFEVATAPGLASDLGLDPPGRLFLCAQEEVFDDPH